MLRVLFLLCLLLCWCNYACSRHVCAFAFKCTVICFVLCRFVQCVFSCSTVPFFHVDGLACGYVLHFCSNWLFMSCVFSCLFVFVLLCVYIIVLLGVAHVQLFDWFVICADATTCLRYACASVFLLQCAMIRFCFL
jgi:hypothetical protein